MLDRLDALRAFTLVAEEGGLAAAARRMKRSPAAVTRAIGALEAELRVPLLQRTTRVVRLTEAGESYLATSRQVLAALDEAAQTLGEAALILPAQNARIPLRLLEMLWDTLTSSYEFRLLHISPHRLSGCRGRLQISSLVEEGFDAAIRLGPLPDSRLTAIRLGEVRRIVVASPGYLAGHPPIAVPADLAGHAILSFARAEAEESWNFVTPVRIAPHAVITDANAAVELAAGGVGITRVLSYQAEAALAAGRLIRLLAAYERPPIPVHLVTPERRPFSARVRAFADHTVPALRAVLSRIEAALARHSGEST